MMKTKRSELTPDANHRIRPVHSKDGANLEALINTLVYRIFPGQPTMTGNGTWYVAPIFPVAVITTEQMANPKKTIGMVSRAVNPRDMTLETVDARGGASISEHQYAQ
jgi:hypothetical protein